MSEEEIVNLRKANIDLIAEVQLLRHQGLALRKSLCALVGSDSKEELTVMLEFFNRGFGKDEYTEAIETLLSLF